MKGQLSLEALITFSAFLAFLLVLLYSFFGLSTRAEDFGEELAAHSCAFETAELAGYYFLDGIGSYFPLELKNAVGVEGDVRCKRGEHNESSKTLVVEDGREPV